MGTSSACARIGSFLALYVVWLVSNSTTIIYHADYCMHDK